MIPAGTRIGSYEVLSPLGAGGMGEVYRARDARLKRDVAIKLLPGLLAGDPERLARFQREAEILAALDHPSIAGIHGLEDASGSPALVLELVEGETLADRIARGPIPLDEALPLAAQIAAALEYAHERGVVHRDLKPANVKVTPDGVVKVLDFGLAKALASDPASAAVVDATMSPTLTAVSQAGVLLGTAAYMSPEQARGKPADRRSDVWAFGCVLYEMLTGRRVVRGQEVGDILAEVLKGTPDWTALPAATPAPVRRLLRRALEKDRTERLADMASARLEIADALVSTDDAGPGPAAPLGPGRRSSWTAAWAATATLAALSVALAWWAPWQTPPLVVPTRLEVSIGADAVLFPVPRAVAVSRDGTTLAFVAFPGGRLTTPTAQQIFVRRLHDLQAVPLPGTEGATTPFFSPDGQSIGFYRIVTAGRGGSAGGELRTVALAGGAVVTIPGTGGAGSATWTERDTIVFSGPELGPLLEVPATGGTAEPVTTLGDDERYHSNPQALPGGNAVLFTATVGSPGGGQILRRRLVVQQIPMGARHVVREDADSGRYLSSGHLMYQRVPESITADRDRTWFAAPFDPVRPDRISPGRPVGGLLPAQALGAQSFFAASDTGTLVFGPSGLQAGLQALTRSRSLHWMDWTGAMTPLRSALPFSAGRPRVAPDGRRLALSMPLATGREIHVIDMERDVLSRVTQGGADEPVWAADSRRIVFASARDGGAANLYWQRADGAGEAQRLTSSGQPQVPSSWHPTRNLLAFHEGPPRGGALRIMLLEIAGDEASGWRPGEPAVLIEGRDRPQFPKFSPDGHWLAYLSDKSGAMELYVRPFPDRSGVEEVKISEGGAGDVWWASTRQEILFRSGPAINGPISAVPYTVDGGVLRPGAPRVLHRGGIWHFDIHPDGERFVVVTEDSTDAPVDLGLDQDTVILILNVFDELRRLVPPR